jgi:4-hydroxy-tetrahydrodipicolinate synthase
MELHKKYYCLFRDLFVETNPIPIKTAMAMKGMIAEEFRLPLCEISASGREKLTAALKRCGIL